MSPADPHAVPVSDARLSPVDARTWSATAAAGSQRIEFRVPAGTVVMLDGIEELFVLPGSARDVPLRGRGSCWVLAESVGQETADQEQPSWRFAADGAIEVRRDGVSHAVVIDAASATVTRHRARPHADVTGAPVELDVPGGGLLADALAGFYWGTMIPSIVERTIAADYADSSGYVISTLADQYLGTYPDVDHEFQIKGRLAWGDRADQDVVRRMIDLQLRMMREDPTGLWRDPCAVQPDGDREYHVRRNSWDRTENAEMFLATGNIAVIESIWLHTARTKDLGWLRANIADIEGAISLVESCIDPLGRLWSDVYYEDQVIKNGRETMSSSLAIRSFTLLAELETLLERHERAEHYLERADALTAALVQPLPQGYWDEGTQRFIDWVDRSGVVHDHIHLLANILPAALGQTSPEQTAAVTALVDRERHEFQRFPTFLAARVEDYTESEIGDGGPYDLCAAGRYWCWDAAYWSWRGDGTMLRQQLDTVAEQGRRDDWYMGERYDMEHVYYQDGSVWHGAAKYYEYPCVYAWVLVHEYLGVRAALDADLLIAPRIADHGTVLLGQDAYRIRWTLSPEGFRLENLADGPRSFRINLSAIVDGATEQRVDVEAGGSVTIPAQGHAG